MDLPSKKKTAAKYSGPQPLKVRDPLLDRSRVKIQLSKETLRALAELADTETIDEFKRLCQASRRRW